MNHGVKQPSGRKPFWQSHFALGWLVFTAVAGYYLLTEHLVHTLSALPYLLLLACPLMHVFMHGGHGGHSSPPQNATKNVTTTRKP